MTGHDDQHNGAGRDTKDETQILKRTRPASPSTATGESTSSGTGEGAVTQRKKPRKKFSLDLGLVHDSSAGKQTSLGAKTPSRPAAPSSADNTSYKPLLFKPTDLAKTTGDSEQVDTKHMQSQLPTPAAINAPDASSVDVNTIEGLARQAGIDEAGLHILEGRRRGQGRRRDQEIKIIDYNVDEQYRMNESLIASGTIPTVRPVHAVGSGRHQLRGLVNSAVQQQESLEEAFAQGRRNKKESGSKYGFS
ncbi:mitotic checkpoint regulator, MAD2B-interacting-domain-containing protein [Dipodascopsis uninucleata]